MTAPDWTAFGRLLADKRHAAGLTRAGLGRLIKRSKETIKLAETGRPPSRATLVRLCNLPELQLSWPEVPGNHPAPDGQASARVPGAAPPKRARRKVDGHEQRPACPACGSTALRPDCRSARTISYKTIDSLRIPGDIPILRCARCCAVFLTAGSPKAAPRIAADIYNARLQRMARAALAALRPHASRRQLEALLGLSHGYLSRLSSQAGTPSPALVALLGLLARDPKPLLGQLRALWLDARDPPDSGSPP